MFPALLALAGAAQMGGNILNAAMGFVNAGQTRAINRQRMRILNANADTAMVRGTAEANRVRDQLDDVLGAQAGFFASGGIDPSMGSPAFLAAQTAAQAELDAMAGTARGLQGRADAFGQMAGLAAQNQDATTSAALGAGTAFLNTVSGWASLGLQNSRMTGGGLAAPIGGGMAGSGPLRLPGSGYSGGSGGGWGGMW